MGIGKVAVSGRYHRSPRTVADDYDVEENVVLASGRNGKVYRAIGKNNKHFAVKYYKLHNLSIAERQELEADVQTSLLLDHPNIARLVDVYEERERLCLVMECLTGGQLYARILELQRFVEVYVAH